MSEFSAQDLARLAALAKLTIDPAEREDVRASLAAVVAYVERLRRLDLAGVEPLTHVGEGVNRLAEDEPDEPLAHEVLRDMAPAMFDGYVRVPKVLGEGGEGGGA